jgi:hypothetical protein
MPYTRWSPNFTPLKTHQFEIDTHTNSGSSFEMESTPVRHLLLLEPALFSQNLALHAAEIG